MEDKLFIINKKIFSSEEILAKKDTEIEYLKAGLNL